MLIGIKIDSELKTSSQVSTIFDGHHYRYEIACKKRVLALLLSDQCLFHYS